MRWNQDCATIFWEMESADIDDAFDQIVLAEETSQQKGFVQGVEHGEASGYQDGYNAGAIQGAKLGSEIGFYEGLALVFKKQLEGDPNTNKRKLKALDGLLEAVSLIPHGNASDPLLHEYVDAARAKFKQVSSLLNLTTSHGEKAESMSF